MSTTVPDDEVEAPEPCESAEEQEPSEETTHDKTHNDLPTTTPKQTLGLRLLGVTLGVVMVLSFMTTLLVGGAHLSLHPEEIDEQQSSAEHYNMQLTEQKQVLQEMLDKSKKH